MDGLKFKGSQQIAGIMFERDPSDAVQFRIVA